MRSFAIILLTAVLCGTSTLVQNSNPAFAQTKDDDCKPSPFEGKWRNQDPNAEHVVELRVVTRCERIHRRAPLVGENSNSPWAGMLKRQTGYVLRQFTLRPTSRCRPADCVWGRKDGKLKADGSLNASFRLFWSERSLKITPDAGRLLVNWRISYIGGKKPDQLGVAVMVREP